MKTQPGLKLSTIAKLLVSVSIFALSINVAKARVVIGVGIYGPVYAQPAPVYYAPPTYYAPPAPAYYAQPANVTWIPDHWEYGYWVPGHYVSYNPAPVAAPGYVWVEGRWGRHHRWHQGYWRAV